MNYSFINMWRKGVFVIVGMNSIFNVFKMYRHIIDPQGSATTSDFN